MDGAVSPEPRGTSYLAAKRLEPATGPTEQAWSWRACSPVRLSGPRDSGALQGPGLGLAKGALGVALQHHRLCAVGALASGPLDRPFPLLGPRWAGPAPRASAGIGSAGSPGERPSSVGPAWPAGHAAPAPASRWGTIALGCRSGVARASRTQEAAPPAPPPGGGWAGLEEAGSAGPQWGAGRPAGLSGAGRAGREPPRGRRSWAEVNRSGSVCLPGGSQAWKCVPSSWLPHSSIPTVTWMRRPRCAGTTCLSTGLVTAVCLALRPPLFRHLFAPVAASGPPLCCGEGERTPVLP